MTHSTALLVIDVQHGLTTGPGQVYDAEGLIARISALTARARTAGAEIVYIQDKDVGPIDSHEWQIHADLDVHPSDLVLRKAFGDSFYQTELNNLLAARGVKRVIVTGCKTDACVEVTARRAVSLGYDVTLVADGHSTTDNRFLRAPASIEYYNHMLDGFGSEDGFGAGKHEIIVQEAAAVEL